MKFREYSKGWLPEVASLDDLVMGVQQHQGAADNLSLRLRKEDGTEYHVPLILPENILARAVIAIVPKQGTATLREVGELELR
jgi:hypothetical protein